MTTVWTCPFCPLACDHLAVVRPTGAPARLEGGRCARAEAALAAATAAGTGPLVDGTEASFDAAMAAAAARLRASAQPLIAALATDVAGARALYPLACALGAICDSDPAAMPALRALQDRGQFTATLAELRQRADLIVFVGGLPLAEAPLIGKRCGLGDPQGPVREVVVLGPQPGDEAVLAAWAGERVRTRSLPLEGDLLRSLALLALPLPPPPLDALAARLRAGRYSVFVGSTARLPAQGALVVEAVNRLVGQLNANTRAAALWIGASTTAQQTFAWLSGLPLRTRFAAPRLEHEPLLYDGDRLLAEGSVDALLWVSAFAPTPPPAAGLPLVALGPPALGAHCRRVGAVFIPVATPGIGAAGHVFRTDGVVLMPLHAVRSDGLPGVDAVATQLLQALKGAR